MMKSAVNQDLKASMFQDVFGYEQKEKVPQAVQEESKDGFAAPNQNVPIVSTAGIESSLLATSYEQAKHDLPEVPLDVVPEHMAANKKQESARVIMETRVIQNLIYSYFNIVKKTISDQVPKTIMAFLINESRKIAQSELVAQIYKAGDLDHLMEEDPMVIEQRNRCRNLIAALKAAMTLIGEVENFEL